MSRTRFLLLLPLLLLPLPASAGKVPKRDGELVEVIGQASDYWYTRNWLAYYWREDFTFQLTEPAGKTWRVISREPTPAYGFRMGTTYTGLPVDWKAKPRVKVVGVKAVDRIPAEFYNVKLDAPHLVTAFLVFVETAPDVWREFYVNNWFHKWHDRADALVYRYYADKPVPYNIYGFARAQAAPFDAKSQAIIDQHKDNPSLMFHGRIHASKAYAFGYEIELIDLIGRNVRSGGHLVLHGDARTIPLLDQRKGKD